MTQGKTAISERKKNQFLFHTTWMYVSQMKYLKSRV